MGNLVVEADPVFGGGHFRTSGVSTSGGTFEFLIDEVEISIISAGNVLLSIRASLEQRALRWYPGVLYGEMLLDYFEAKICSVSPSCDVRRSTSREERPWTRMELAGQSHWRRVRV